MAMNRNSYNIYIIKFYKNKRITLRKYTQFKFVPVYIFSLLHMDAGEVNREKFSYELKAAAAC